MCLLNINSNYFIKVYLYVLKVSSNKLDLYERKPIKGNL